MSLIKYEIEVKEEICTCNADWDEIDKTEHISAPKPESNCEMMPEETPAEVFLTPEFVNVECGDLSDLILMKEEGDIDDELCLDNESELSLVTTLRTELNDNTKEDVGKKYTRVRRRKVYRPKKNYQCHICGQDFTARTVLETHLLAHSNERKYKCDQCDFSANVPAYIKNHQLTHSEEKNCKCPQCEYSTRRPIQLKRHILTKHTKHRPHKCTICEYATTQRYHLQVHMRTHTGDKPYKCDVCQAGFVQRWHLKTHIRKHTGEKPYKCQHCDYAGAQITALKWHMRTRHKP